MKISYMEKGVPTGVGGQQRCVPALWFVQVNAVARVEAVDEVDSGRTRVRVALRGRR